MTTEERIAVARAEIEQRRKGAQVVSGAFMGQSAGPAVAPALEHIFGVYELLEGILERHEFYEGGHVEALGITVTSGCVCGSDEWPCEDLAPVLNLLAPL